MKWITSTVLLAITSASIAQVFPWQPSEIILNQKDTFMLVERIEFDTDNRLLWLTNYELDENGITVRKVELNGETHSLYKESSIRENGSRDFSVYRNYQKKHQDSVTFLESVSHYDTQNRLILKIGYNQSGKVIDSVVNIYNELGLITQRTWGISFDLKLDKRYEKTSTMTVIQSDTGTFCTRSFVDRTYFRNKLFSSTSTTTTYHYNSDNKLIEERYFMNAPMASPQLTSNVGNGVPTNSSNSKDISDTLRKIILHKYDENNNLIYASHSTSLHAEPFLQDHYEYDKKSRLVNSYQINSEGIRTNEIVINYQKKRGNTEVTSKHLGDQYTAEHTTVRIIDSNGRFLKSAEYYDRSKVSTDEWHYTESSDTYQIELKQCWFEQNTKNESCTRARWSYVKK